MLLAYKDLYKGMEIFHEGDRLVVANHGDPHNVEACEPGGVSAILCFIPGCELYSPVFDSQVESEEYHRSLKGTDLHASYVDQNGCWNCAHRFCYHEFDEAVGHFCNAVDPGSRPPCDSVAMSEIPMPAYNHDEGKSQEENEAAHAEEDKVYHERVALWTAWASRHPVSPQGICGLWAHEHPAQES